MMESFIPSNLLLRMPIMGAHKATKAAAIKRRRRLKNAATRERAAAKRTAK